MTKRFETAEGLPRYFKNLDAVAVPLSKVEEHALAIRIQAGDELAINQLVTANLKFVVTLANKFIGMGISIDDLIQEGNIGLIEAARKFTPDRNVKFITYAQFWIRKRLNLAICDHGRIVRLPVNQEYDIYKRKMQGEEINLKQVQIDKPIGEDGDNTIGDLMLKSEFQDPFEREEANRVLARLLSKLKPPDREIVELFYGLVGDGLSTKQIAQQIGITATEVNRSLKIARSQMRKSVNR